MISKEQTQHIAKLARLGLSEKEIGKMQKELSSILDYVEKLKKLDVSNTKEDLHTLPVNLGGEAQREDIVKSQEEKTTKKLIDLAPQKKEGYLQVKEVF